MKTTKKNLLDEMQEQKLLHIEHNGVWLAFWGLLAVMLLQILLDKGEGMIVQQLAGEWLIFMALCIYLGLACLKNGIWDRRLSATPKTNFLVSLAAGLVMAVFNFVSSYLHYGALAGAVAAGVFVGGSVLAACWIALSLVARIYKKRLAQLEQEGEEQSPAGQDADPE